MRDLLDILLRVNLAVAAAVLAVLLLRIPARRLFGPRLAYALWGLPALAIVAALLPAPVIILPAPPSPDITAFPLHPGVAAKASAAQSATPVDMSAWLVTGWALGAAALLLAFGRAQARFNRAIRQGRAGPAVIGVLQPRVVTPADFTAFYSQQEQRLVLTHEAIHIARQDSRINALMALACCLAWFNPLVHLMARLMRIDQEFACDAAVMTRHPRSRRAYAEALLKTQAGAHALPFGCYWSMTPAHPLVERVSLLTRPRGDTFIRTAGVTLLALTTLGGAATIWAARPPRVVLLPSHEAEILDRLVRYAPVRKAPPPIVAAAKTSREPRDTVALASPILAKTIEPETPLPSISDSPPLIRVADIAPPPRQARVWKTSNLSWVEPGLAVRVVATMTDPDGVPLITDLTAFGSQALFRLGYIQRHQSRDKLFTRVVQHGDRLEVWASLGSGFWPEVTGSVSLASGETGAIRLPGGRLVTVTPIVRPETAEEIAAARALGSRPAMNFERFEQSL